ncbi:DUF7114 family protein [Halorarum salinum]|uniref:Polyprenyl synthetase n=1 Tax=Halorarum salinum TaxID=2743089 RepID=A0A7D5L9K4_9EURY|nr:hypothetical protein [Halobaculum salinum]QLG61207.1 hypothetical protein HUG12_05435 [Halobaculum salinum]
MDDAVRVREAAEGALADVEPERLRELLAGRVADAEMTPGVLTLVSARALDPAAPADGVAERAAGVQLVYEGLRLTRRLAHEEPWTALDLEGGSDVDADMDVLAADVFVARGFYLLARTGAAEKAVETVRAFGRDQTRRRGAACSVDGAALDRNLEADVFELAVVAGTDTVGAEAPEELVAYAAELAAADDARMPGERALPDGAGDRIAALADERVASSVDP